MAFTGLASPGTSSDRQNKVYVGSSRAVRPFASLVTIWRASTSTKPSARKRIRLRETSSRTITSNHDHFAAQGPHATTEVCLAQAACVKLFYQLERLERRSTMLPNPAVSSALSGVQREQD